MPKIDKQKRYIDIFAADTPEERLQLIRELETADEDTLFVTQRLSRAQVRTLAQYLLLLPDVDFRALVLFYCLGYSHRRLERQLGIQHPKGTLAYLRDRLTQCMGLPRPIGERYWRAAASLAAELRHG